MGQLPKELQRVCDAEKIHVTAFFGIKKQGEPPFFMSAVYPAEPDDYSAILDKDLLYAFTRADTPEEAVAAIRDKLHGGL